MKNKIKKKEAENTNARRRHTTAQINEGERNALILARKRDGAFGVDFV